MSLARSILPPSYAPTRPELVGTGLQGTVYVVHFARPLAHAQHYIGWTVDLGKRMAQHRAGWGGRLMASVQAAQIPWSVVHTEQGDRYRERQLKNRSSAARRLCWVCSIEEVAVAKGSVPYVETRARAHVVSFQGAGKPWVSICGYHVRRHWSAVRWAPSQPLQRSWCPWCTVKVEAMASAVLGFVNGACGNAK